VETLVTSSVHGRGSGTRHAAGALWKQTPVNEAWERDVGGVKAFFRERCREALEIRRGAA
jgi:hypothetical protein